MSTSALATHSVIALALRRQKFKSRFDDDTGAQSDFSVYEIIVAFRDKLVRQ